MRNAYSRLLALAQTICGWATIAAFGVLICVVTLQVVGRLPGAPSPAWTEEVARFALLHLVAFSCGLAVLRGDLVNVDLFVNLLSERARKVAGVAVDLIIFVFAIAIIPGCWAYVTSGLGERARSLDVPMLSVYVVMLIIPIALAFFALARLLGFGSAPQHQELV